MKDDKLVHLAPKLLTVIVDRNNVNKLEEVLSEKHVLLHYMFNGMGTASSEILKSIGLSGTEKTVCVCMAPSFKAMPLMTSITDRLSLTRSGNGIAFIVPISGISAAVSGMFGDELEHLKERLDRSMEMGMEDVNSDSGFALVISVINKGFSETLMDAARTVGARGGTIIPARHSGIEDAVKFFGVTLQEEKEIVTILIPRSQKKELMKAISKKCGLNTEAHGVIVSVPIEVCAGIGNTED